MNRIRRIISLDPNLGDGRSDSVDRIPYDFEGVLAECARCRGLDYAVLGGVADERPEDAPDVLPVFEEPALQLGTSEKWPDRFRAAPELGQAVLEGIEALGPGPGGPAADLLFMREAEPEHLAVALWVGTALAGATPIVLNLTALHRLYGPGRSPKIPGFRRLLDDTRSLRRRANVHLRVDSTRLADSIVADTGTRLEILPVFSHLAEPERPGPRQPDGKLRILFPTTRSERAKGFDLVVALATRLDPGRFEVISRLPARPPPDVSVPSAAARSACLRLASPFVSQVEYLRLLQSSDLVVLPYRLSVYSSRPSDVLADAFCLGVPVVGTDQCWIGDQIHAFRAGRTFEDGNLDAFVEAVVALADDLGSHRATLREHRQTWLEDHSPDAFLDALIAPSHATRPATASRPLPRSAKDLVAALLASSVETSRRLDSLRWTTRELRRPRIGRGRVVILSEEGYGFQLGGTHSHHQPVARWECADTTEVELRLDAPNGTFVASHTGPGEIRGLHWVLPGRRIFLQDVTGGKSLTEDHTIATAVFPKRRAQEPSTTDDGAQPVPWLLASPLGFLRRLVPSQRVARGRLNVTVERDTPEGTVERVRWSCQGTRQASVWRAADSRDPPSAWELLGRGKPDGETLPGHWLTPGASLWLVCGHCRPSSPLQVLDRVATAEPQARRPARLEYELVGSSGWPAVAILRWTVPEQCWVEIRVDSPNGKCFTAREGAGEARTERWVQPDMRFYLVAMRDGLAVEVLDSVQVRSDDTTPGADPPASARPRREPTDVLGPDEWGLLVPAGSGEAFALGRYAPAIAKHLGGERFHVFGNASQLDILSLFPDAPMKLWDSGAFRIPDFRERRQLGRLVQLYYGLARLGGDMNELPLGPSSRGFLQVLFDELGVEMDPAQRLMPQVPPETRDRVRARFRDLGLDPGCTAILAPRLNASSALPIETWNVIVDALLSRGYCVATNCAPDDDPLPNTVPLRLLLSELYAAVELAGLCVTSRSGLCELCSTCNADLHVLRFDRLSGMLPGVMVQESLRDNGMTDNAVYHVRSMDQDFTEFAREVVKHPALRSRR